MFRVFLPQWTWKYIGFPRIDSQPSNTSGASSEQPCKTGTTQPWLVIGFMKLPLKSLKPCFSHGSQIFIEREVKLHFHSSGESWSSLKVSHPPPPLFFNLWAPPRFGRWFSCIVFQICRPWFQGIAAVRSPELAVSPTLIIFHEETHREI